MNETATLAKRPATAVAPVTLETRLKLLQAVEREVAWVSRQLSAPASVTLAAQAKITHALIHRLNSYRGRGLDVDRLLARLEDIVHRKVVREWKRQLVQGQAMRAPVLDDEGTRRILGDPFARRPRVQMNRLLHAYTALSPVETQVFRLEGIGCSTELVAAILGLSVNAVEFHRNQGRQKIHRVYMGLS